MLLILKMTTAAKAALIAVIMIVWYILVESALQMRVRYAAALFRCVNFVRKLENEEVRRHAASPSLLERWNIQNNLYNGRFEDVHDDWT